MKCYDTESFVTTPLNYKNIKEFHGEVIEEMSLFMKPFGIEIKTDKAIYQIYYDEGQRVAERTTFKVADQDSPWCVYPEKETCRGCDHSYAPELSDGGCKLMTFRGDEA